jgi:hypothetical protein
MLFCAIALAVAPNSQIAAASVRAHRGVSAVDTRRNRAIIGGAPTNPDTFGFF